ncbi:hypothetical protein RLM55_00500, partial [Streptococcus pneumoniae]|nr:hypothetical protein [Streptococcus pneumoniae]
QLSDELARLQAAEVLLPDQAAAKLRLPENCNPTRLHDWQFAPDSAHTLLTDYFGCQDLLGFGLQFGEHDPAIGAAGAL